MNKAVKKTFVYTIFKGKQILKKGVLVGSSSREQANRIINNILTKTMPIEIDGIRKDLQKQCNSLR